MAWIVLALGLAAAAFTVHAWRPVRAPSPVALVSFFASLVATIELAVHHAAWQALAAAFAVRAGAAQSWPGAVGVGLSRAVGGGARRAPPARGARRGGHRPVAPVGHR